MEEHRPVEGDELAHELGRVGGEGDQEGLRAADEGLRGVAAGRRAGIEALAPDLDRAHRGVAGVEEDQVAPRHPLLGVAGETPEDLLDLVDAEAREHVELRLLAHGPRARVVAGLGDRAGPHFPEREAERVEVVLERGAAREDALGRHVVRGAAVGRRVGPAGAGEPAALLGEAEVEHDGPVERAVGVRGDHDVARLDVAVHEPGGVDGGDALADVGGDAAELVAAVAAVAFSLADVLVQRLPDDVLHHQDRPVGRGHEVVDAADVGARHAPGDDHLEAEGLVVAGHARVGADDLERDEVQRGAIVGEKHLAHTADAETPADLVTVVDDRSALKWGQVGALLFDHDGGGSRGSSILGSDATREDVHSHSSASRVTRKGAIEAGCGRVRGSPLTALRGRVPPLTSGLQSGR